jgi:hypothetical protein
MSVAIGVSLATASLVIGVLRSVVAPPPGSLFVPILVVAALGALIYAVWSQRGWARWIFLVLFLIGLPAVFFIRQLLLQQGALAMVVMAVQTILQGAALWYFFVPVSNAWFRNRHQK